MLNGLKWADRALEEYDKLLDYLYGEWGEDIAIEVAIKIDHTILRIQTSPEHFPFYRKKKKIRRCVASPQTSIYFHFEHDMVEILSLFDNRQNPKKRKF